MKMRWKRKGPWKGSSVDWGRTAADGHFDIRGWIIEGASFRRHVPVGRWAACVPTEFGVDITVHARRCDAKRAVECAVAGTPLRLDPGELRRRDARRFLRRLGKKPALMAIALGVCAMLVPVGFAWAKQAQSKETST